jgi:hypothetical protein
VLGSPHFRTFNNEGDQTGINLNGFPTNRKLLDSANPLWGGRKATLISGWNIENIVQMPGDDRLGLFARVWNTGIESLKRLSAMRRD